MDLMKDLNALNVALKSNKKENNDAAHKNRKKVENLEAKVEDLLQFKVTKELEEKDLKNKSKKLDKKLKSIQEREAELKVLKNRIERPTSGKVDTNALENNFANLPEVAFSSLLLAQVV